MIDWVAAGFGLAAMGSGIGSWVQSSRAKASAAAAEANSRPVGNGFTAHVLEDLKAIRDRMDEESRARIEAQKVADQRHEEAQRVADRRHEENIGRFATIEARLEDVRNPPAIAQAPRPPRQRRAAS